MLNINNHRMQFNTKIEIAPHVIKDVNDPSNDIWHCDLCSKSYNTKKKMAVHMKNSHIKELVQMHHRQVHQSFLCKSSSQESHSCPHRRQTIRLYRSELHSSFQWKILSRFSHEEASWWVRVQLCQLFVAILHREAIKNSRDALSRHFQAAQTLQVWRPQQSSRWEWGSTCQEEICLRTKRWKIQMSSS